MAKIALINGPNLNLLGSREPKIYGHTSLAEMEARLAAEAASLGHELLCHQSNHEGVLIDLIQQARTESAGIIINPAALTHTSIALFDALSAFGGTVVEVHLSNVHRREGFRHHSYVSLRADAVIAGCGVDGYGFALRFIHTKLMPQA